MTEIISLIFVTICYVHNSGCLSTGKVRVEGHIGSEDPLGHLGSKGLASLERGLTDPIRGIVREVNHGRKELGSILGGIFHVHGGSGESKNNGENYSNGKWSTSGEYNGYGGIGGEIGGEGNYNGGSGYNRSSSNIKSILNALLNLPIKLPRNILRSISIFGRNILTLNRKALKIPFSGIRNVASFFRNIFVSITTRIVNVIMKIHSINADLVIGAIRSIKGVFGWIIQRIVSLNIFGLQTGQSIVGFFRKRIDNVIGGILDAIVWILLQFNKIILGGVKISHIGDILKLPVVKQIVSFHSDIRNKVVKLIFSQLIEIGKFFDMIVFNHRDFFYPIFRKLLNVFLSFTNFINQLMDEGYVEGGYAETNGSSSGTLTAGNRYPGSWSLSGQSGGNPGGDSSKLGEDGSSSEGGELNLGAGINLGDGVPTSDTSGSTDSFNQNENNTQEIEY